MGCTLAARRAGIQLAHNATIISSVAAPHSVTGSDGVMPNSIDFTHRVTANDAPMPIAIAAADSAQHHVQHVPWERAKRHLR